MPFTPKSEAAMNAMSTDQLSTYLGVVERVFTAVRRRHGRLRTTGPCPQDWRDLVAEITNVQRELFFRSIVDAHVDAMLPSGDEDPCADPN